MTYQSFTDPYTFFEKLKQRYNVPSELEKRAIPIQLRLSIVLKHWVETQLDDFDEDLVEVLREFITSLAHQDALKKVAESLNNYLADQVNDQLLLFCTYMLIDRKKGSTHTFMVPSSRANRNS